MTTNMGTIDRTVRVILGALFILAFFMGWVSGIFGWILLVLGGVFLLTSAVSTCPLYAPLGITTKSHDS